MQTIFDNSINTPLADRIRPKSYEDVVGQKHLLGSDRPLRKFFEQKRFPSMILWGPPGVGKTTLATIIAQTGEYQFHRLSAVESGVKEVRAVLSTAEKARMSGERTLLFIDEIHRFNKNQQDALLHAVEKGIVTLVGATTENPSFEVNSALLSRCQIYKLSELNFDDINELIELTLKKDEILSELNVQISAEVREYIYQLSGGDARSVLNAIDLVVNMYYEEAKESKSLEINEAMLEVALQQKTAKYDKNGESHYDTISAFIKSLRGSDPDAAMFWLAKMLEAGEDPKFIARRMVIFASEDVGNADPLALVVAVNVFRAVEVIGIPEAAINLAQGVTYLASAPKSNASYMALNIAKAEIASGVDTTVPLHLRNAPTSYMKKEGYGSNYKYPHNYPQHFVSENYFPESIGERLYYEPTELGREKAIREKLHSIWKGRYDK